MQEAHIQEANVQEACIPKDAGLLHATRATPRGASGNRVPAYFASPSPAGCSWLIKAGQVLIDSKWQ